MTVRRLTCKCGASCTARTIEDFEFGPPEYEEPPEADYDPGPSLMDQYHAAWQSKFGHGGTHRR